MQPANYPRRQGPRSEFSGFRSFGLRAALRTRHSLDFFGSFCVKTKRTKTPEIENKPSAHHGDGSMNEMYTKLYAQKNYSRINRNYL